MPQTIQGAIGAFVAQFREQHRLTQEQIALKSRPFGTKWGASKIRRVEDGDAQLSLGDLAILLEVLRRAGRRPVTVKDLFPDDLIMSIGDVPISGAELRGILRGDASAWLEPRRIGFGIDNLIDGDPEPPTLATRRAAKRLGITPEELDSISIERWAESFDEIVKSLSDGTSPQAKGHANRRVILELSEALARRAVNDLDAHRQKKANVGSPAHHVPTEEEAIQLGAVANTVTEEATEDDDQDATE